MTTKHIHFPLTTAQQRKLLFETWQATGNVTAACRKAHVGRGTFYYWKPRFDAQGFPGLAEFASRAAKEPHRTPAAVAQQVLALRREHPDWGKKRLADELAKANNWVPLVGPNTVKRILQDAGLWATTEAGGGKKDAPPASRSAEQPGQTLNVDLCFVPATHAVSAKLPAVSGSSGRLIVERPPAEDNIGAWPGRIFENPELSYEDAMLAFVATAQERASQPASLADAAANGSLATEKRTLGRSEAQLRDARRQVRAQRQLEDAAWQAARVAQRAAAQADQVRPKAARRSAKAARTAQWRALRDQRRATLAARQQDDAAWRQARLELRQRWSALPVISAWIAILVIVDNCTRQCLGLPLFVAGPKVTAEMIVEALGRLLPPELQFLITDRGTHFTANAFKTLVLSEAFIHVLIARHRPESNGIAERFVRTLKEWLADKAWLDDQALATLLQQFLAEYGDRPHQGLAMPGLSPNEFAKRIWLM